MEQRLNAILAQHHPAALAVMTDLGKRLYFPKGVPVQGAQAKEAGCPFNATIGELKGEDGAALPLPTMQEDDCRFVSRREFSLSSTRWTQRFA